MKVDYNGPGSFQAVWVGPNEYVPGEFLPDLPERQLDQVRAAALAAAVQYARMAPIPPTPERVTHIAEEFERWLAGTDEDS